MNNKPLTDESGEVRELTEDDFNKMVPMDELLPELTHDLIATQKTDTLTVKPIGRPKSDKHKVVTTVRFDTEIIEFFKRDGRGWQTRLNAALREYIASHGG